MAPSSAVDVTKHESFGKFRQMPLVMFSDMVLEQENDVKDLIVMCVDKTIASRDYEAAAAAIKTALDKKYGGPWHVCLGEGFGASVVHQSRNIIQICHGGSEPDQNSVSVIAFKSA